MNLHTLLSLLCKSKRFENDQLFQMQSALVGAFIQANQENSNLIVADEIFQQAFNYCSNLPPLILCQAATIKFKLRKFHEAIKLLNKIMDNFLQASPHDRQLIEESVAQMIVICQDNPPAYLLADIAFIKFELHKWLEASNFYDRAILAYGNEVPMDLIYKATLAKSCLPTKV
jgi:tetratricopeptide (TPR) repeat protein